MLENYKNLLKEHVIQALTNANLEPLKQYTEQLIQENELAREHILEAHEELIKELVGTSEAS